MIDVNDKLFTVKQVADMMQLSVGAIQKRIKRKQMTAHKIGKYYYFLNSELMQTVRQSPNPNESLTADSK